MRRSPRSAPTPVTALAAGAVALGTAGPAAADDALHVIYDAVGSSVIANPKSSDIIAGGTVTGTSTIGQFGNCGVTTGIINQLVPGPGNTVSLTLSNGRAGG